MNKNLLLILVSLLFFISCRADREQPDDTIRHSNSTKLLQGSKLDISEDLFQIRDIHLIKHEERYFALVTDISGEQPVHLINVSDETYIAGLSRIGRGPGEFTQAISISYWDNTFTINDPANSRLTHIPVGVLEQAEIRNHHAFESTNIQPSGLPLTVHRMDSVNYLVIGPIRTTENRRFSMINTMDNSILLAGKHESFDPNVDPNTQQLANREHGTFSHENSLFATGKYHQDRVDIFDLEGNPVASYKGPDYEDIHYKIEGNQYRLDTENNIIGYVDIASNSDFIYALYSGKKLTQDLRNFGDVVIVVNWEGEFVDSYQLDKPALSIAVDGDNQVVLTSVHGEEPGLYLYHINHEE